MSADNWTICPKCGGITSEKHREWNKKAEEIGAMYGKVPSDEYLAAMSELPAKPRPDETLREDYEIGIGDGIFSVDYSAHCTACKYSFEYKHAEEVVR